MTNWDEIKRNGWRRLGLDEELEKFLYIADPPFEDKKSNLAKVMFNYICRPQMKNVNAAVRSKVEEPISIEDLTEAVTHDYHTKRIEPNAEKILLAAENLTYEGLVKKISKRHEEEGTFYAPTMLGKKLMHVMLGYGPNCVHHGCMTQNI